MLIKKKLIKQVLSLLLIGLVILSAHLIAEGLYLKKSLNDLTIFHNSTNSASDLQKIRGSAKRSKFSLKIFNIITIHQLSSLMQYQTLLNIIDNALLALDQTQIFNPSANNIKIPDLSVINQVIADIQYYNGIQYYNQKHQDHVLAHKFPDLSQVEQPLELISILLEQLSQDRKNEVIVLFQNSDEIRATGGFLGSFFYAKFQDKKLQKWSIEDIYDVDGQIRKTLPAEVGVSEYLTAGGGLNLVNANWNPDFDQSATDILFLLEQANIDNVKIVVAVTSNFFSQIMAMIGPIELPDYPNFTLTSDNFNDVLRDARGEFFPGSRQKKHVLEHAFFQVVDRASKQKELLLQAPAIIEQALAQKDLQIFSTNHQVADYFENNKLIKTHRFPFSSEEYLKNELDPIVLVESNVGINKANKNVGRTLMINRSDQELNLRIKFDNHNLKSESTTLGESLPIKAVGDSAKDQVYINYYRIILSGEWEVLSVKIDNKPASWTQSSIAQQTDKERQKSLESHASATSATNTAEITDTTNITDRTNTIKENDLNQKQKNKKKLKQISLLLTIPEQESRELTIKIKKNTPIAENFFIWKQAGLAPFELKFHSLKEVSTYLIDRDLIIPSI